MLFKYAFCAVAHILQLFYGVFLSLRTSGQVGIGTPVQTCPFDLLLASLPQPMKGKQATQLATRRQIENAR